MVNKKIIQKKLLFLLKDLVKIDTSYPPGNSYKFDQYIRKYLKGTNLQINSNASQYFIPTFNPLY